MSSELTLKEEYLAGKTKVFVSGEVDIYTAQSFKDKVYSIVEKADNDIIIDCTGLNYIDSTGLGIFVGALKKAKLTGKSICLENIKDNIKKLFVITGLDKLFNIQ
jgi:anti-sigma B factor antagonist